MKPSEIEAFLVRYGAALSESRFDELAEAWAIPSLVVSDQGTLAVADRKEVSDFFARAVKSYHARGVMATRPELLQWEVLSPGLVSVDVAWPGYDERGLEIKGSREFSRYILSVSADGKIRICVAVGRSAH